MFLGVIYPTVYTKMTSCHPKCANPRWLPKWPPNAISHHNSGSRADRVVRAMANYMYMFSICLLQMSASKVALFINNKGQIRDVCQNDCEIDCQM